jgi:hypothetical protein
MKTMALATLFLPAAASPLVLLLSGSMLIIGLRRLAGRLAALAILVAMFPIIEPMLDVVLDALPLWLSWLVPASIVLLILSALGLGTFLHRTLASTVGIFLAAAIWFVIRLIGNGKR